MSEPNAVERHYAGDTLRDRLEAALTAAGLGEGRLSPTDLAPLDQFHTRGLQATVDLAAAAAFAPGSTVLDIGSGLGGPSRYLAATGSLHVRGIDLSPAFVAAATHLAERSGLSDRVDYRVGDALDLPFPDASFDHAWTQHVAMNIADRPRLYREAARVVKPGGTLALYDVVAGSGEPLHFPVPWARSEATSFLLTPDELRAVLAAAGWTPRAWRDRTADAVAWNQARRAAAGAPPPLGLHLAMGPDFPAMAANLGRDLAEGRAGILEAVLERR